MFIFRIFCLCENFKNLRGKFSIAEVAKLMYSISLLNPIAAEILFIVQFKFDKSDCEISPFSRNDGKSTQKDCNGKRDYSYRLAIPVISILSHHHINGLSHLINLCKFASL